MSAYANISPCLSEHPKEGNAGGGAFLAQMFVSNVHARSERVT